MIGWMVRSAFYALAIAALAYVAVFVPVGRHTLYGHAVRIGRTPEARELGSSVSKVVERARQAVVRETLAHTP